jgi:hypothetical protein
MKLYISPVINCNFVGATLAVVLNLEYVSKLKTFAKIGRRQASPLQKYIFLTLRSTECSVKSEAGQTVPLTINGTVKKSGIRVFSNF